MTTHGNMVITAHDNRPYKEGIISGTPSPGCAAQIQAGTPSRSGRMTWELYAPTADGDIPNNPFTIFVNNAHLGRAPTVDYVDGENGFLWTPFAGEELLVLVVAGAGALAVGAQLTPVTGTGLHKVAAGTEDIAPWTVLEGVTVGGENTLVHCMYNG